MPNISDLAPEPADCGTVIIRGPKGDKGDTGEPGSPNVRVSDPITADGTGTASDPYVIGLGLSTDADNPLRLGTDGGLFVPALVWDKTNTYAMPGEGQAGKLLDFKSLTDDNSSDFIISRNSAGEWLTTWRQNGQILMLDRGNNYPGGHLRVYRYSSVAGTELAAGFGGTAAATPTASFTYDGQLSLDNAATTLTPASGIGVYAEDDVFKVLGPDGSVIALNPSPDPSNQLSLDANGNLYVTATTNVGDNTYLVGDGLQQTGTGTAEDPYILAVHLSADAGNALAYGTDGGLYVPTIAAGVSSVTAADSTVTVTPAEGDVTVAANISADTGNQLAPGADGGLYVPQARASALSYGAAALADKIALPSTWIDLPMKLLGADGASLGSNGLVLNEPGVWMYTVSLSAYGTSASTDASLYLRCQPNTIYGSFNFGPRPTSMLIVGVTGFVSFASGTKTLIPQSQASNLGVITAAELQLNAWRVGPAPAVEA
ncbi:hypothetical protein ACIRLA_46370 [Streptomyces sp. NPDC102364]|uniref:hypothetical protein n=1 Tax=Streptomyces sp. NPDC102364 TaxID=3366161 RepID=UPI0037F3BD13